MRQSSYGDRGAGVATPLGTTRAVHSYLKDPDDSARFSIDLAAGAEVTLKVLGAREEARSESRAMARDRGRATSMSPAMSGAARGASMESTPASQGRAASPPRLQMFPALALEVRVDGAVVADGAPFARVRAERAGKCEVRVYAASGDDGGLFELQVAAGPPTLALHGVVVGADDEQLAGVELAFLRDPDGDEWARTTTGADGSYSVSVPAGDYLVLLAAKDGRTHEIRMGISAAAALDLLWPADTK